MIRVLAPAKINLGLDILRKREDGYHDLRTLFLAIDWNDELTIDFANGGTDVLTVGGPHAAGVPTDGTNLVLKAVNLLRQEVSNKIPALVIHLTKNIPSQAGLGGGSSDGTAALMGVNHLLELGLKAEELERLALRLGSDCPFFVRGGMQEAEGRGEVLFDMRSPSIIYGIVIVPHEVISTREAFASLRPEDMGEQTKWTVLKQWVGSSFNYFRAREVPEPPPRVHNAFQYHARITHPGVAKALNWLESNGAMVAALSGSGSACFGVFKDKKVTRTAIEQWKGTARNVKCFATTGRGVSLG